MNRRDLLKSVALGVASIYVPDKVLGLESIGFDSGARDFLQPPDDARPWVYWYFMDGHLTREGMEADLAAMKKAGIGGAIFLEVGIGLPRGPIEFMSQAWQELLGHAFDTAGRLGLQLALAAGPGWCGAGGPWVKPSQSMQHLVFSKTVVEGPSSLDIRLPQPQPRTPFFGEDTLSTELLEVWKDFYYDEFVLAFRTPSAAACIPDIDEKALYTRGSYSSQIPGPYAKRPWVRPFLPTLRRDADLPAKTSVASAEVVNLTGKLLPDGRLAWAAPPGSWTVMRFGRTLTGQTTRPSPKPGLGLESDKFAASAMDAHFDAYIRPLLKETGAPRHPGRGLVALHFDSWEMGSQNWSPRFQEEFKRRRGYDPVTFLPTFAGLVVDSREMSERFLWDIRQTAQELVSSNQALRLGERGKEYGLFLELEPYDLNPCGDLELGSAADVPMGEFWSKTPGAPPTDFSLPEAVSVGHTEGRKVIGAESFTAAMEEKGHQHPASMKVQGDWAFCQGINKFVIHRYQAQPWLDRFPGMTMGLDGGYGVHWERTQTWWDFVSAYHLYLSRCQHMLRRGLPVADILYLNPEGAPSVFFPPRSAFRPGHFADRRGYNFDGCAPETLIKRASVKDGRIVFPDGMSYSILVLPRFSTMTPRLLAKIAELVEAGATLLGAPPDSSPSLEHYPECDRQVRELASKLWPQGKLQPERRVGKGRVFSDPGAACCDATNPLASAKWIWSQNPDTTASGATLYLTRDFSFEDAREVETAVLTMTADKSYESSLNGVFIMSGHAEPRVRRIDVSALLRSGANRITVAVKRNFADSGRSGLIAALAIRSLAGDTTCISTDHAWTCSNAKDGPQSPVEELGPYDIAPWNLNDKSIEQGDIYPSYATTAKLLQSMGIESDFESDAPLRYTHRFENDEDLYFVANGRDLEQSATCSFRVTGKQPQWWNPQTGERRDLPEFSETSGRTVIPMRLQPYESGFILFRKRSRSPSVGGENFPRFETLMALKSPWRVGFDPKWGGPVEVTFSQLESWATRAEPGLRNYSGKGVYRTRFDCDGVTSGEDYFLSLGKVAVIASIRLNGHELGILWCEPWRVAIPRGVLQPKDNALEIVVANLWTNRLIADSGLPQEERLTWTTSNPFHPGDPLVESGLLGPVTIQMQASGKG